MLMMGNKEKAVGLILKGLGGKDAAATAEKSVPSPVENDYSEGHKIAAQDFLSAVESKDVGRIVSAFKAMYEMCEIEPEDG